MQVTIELCYTVFHQISYIHAAFIQSFSHLTAFLDDIKKYQFSKGHKIDSDKDLYRITLT